MVMRSLVVDSGSTTRQPRRIFAVDSGSTARLIMRGFVIDSGGTARQIFSGDQISLSNLSVSHDALDPADSFAFYNLESDGDVSETLGLGSPSDIGDWITPKINMANYESRATLLSGSTPSGTLNTWQVLSSTRTWSLSQTTVGSKSCSLTIEIRRASDAFVMASATVNLSVQVD